jgi:hypothetical protein
MSILYVFVGVWLRCNVPLQVGVWLRCKLLRCNLLVYGSVATIFVGVWLRCNLPVATVATRCNFGVWLRCNWLRCNPLQCVRCNVGSVAMYQPLRCSSY